MGGTLPAVHVTNPDEPPRSARLDRALRDRISTQPAALLDHEPATRV
ncbi:Hypothetical protein CAP_3444 [Chondromyces apiculatus DSM 436]|uniref:Uncharacterized protein n=1 Tax=Chondromyces apiculatus DSM 436 TaxID=1192034 RepID=A0A017T7Q5_9BACT|nr:Hypothetical protein CAP_3444 [Chondromyces apiculatus DSM 436]